MYVDVAIEEATFAFDKLYTYEVPQPLLQQIVVGTVVLVPFGRGRAKPRIGVVIKQTSNSKPRGHVKELLAAVPAEEALSDEALGMVRYLKQATFCTWYEAVKTVVPRGGRYQPMQTKNGTWILKKQMQRQNETAYEQVGELCKTHKNWTEKQKRVLLFLQNGPRGRQEICDECEVGISVADGLVKQGVLRAFQREKAQTIKEVSSLAQVVLPVLNKEQQQVQEDLLKKQAEQDTRPALLYGVTGSGKTAVFLHLAEHFLQDKKSCLILVPEIGLTQQMIDKFREAFGSRVAVQHSALSAGERFAQWQSVRKGEVEVVIGTRSAVFAPLEKIGLIVLDEEQEKSYQSDASPRYDAIEVAKRRALRHGALLVLASATPSVADYHAACEGRYSLHCLLKRYGDLPLPSVEMADMRGEMKMGNAGAIGQQLSLAITEMLEQKRQVILLLNRRGYHRVGVCRTCGEPLRCEDCSVPMTFHRKQSKTKEVPKDMSSEDRAENIVLAEKGDPQSTLLLWQTLTKQASGTQNNEHNEEEFTGFGKLLCHYCGKTVQPAPALCPDCGGELRYTGFGTQRVEEELQLRFPSARVLRMDLDTTRRKGAHKKMLQDFRGGEYDILLGTQMVAKGLDFAKVGLVGVVGIDSLLFGQGYRTMEHVFSLVTQVVGRAGRFDECGHAMIQTMDPDNAVLQLAASQNYPAFYEQEIEFRRMALYPPFCSLCVVGFVSQEEGHVMQAAQDFASILKNETQNSAPMPLRVLGPAPMHVNRVAGQWRWRLTIKCRLDAEFRALLNRSLQAFSKKDSAKKTNLYVDFNADTVY